jgi:two-component system response regulator AdeR
MRSILIVEDDPIIQAVLDDLLTDEGYATLLAGDGQTAVALAHARHPDVILMDLRLPVLDGVTALRRLKQEPATAHIPVLAFSAEPGLLRAVSWLADDVVAKPFDLEDVLRRVQRLDAAGRQPHHERSARERHPR